MVESEQRPEQFLEAAEDGCNRILKKEEKHVDDAHWMKTGLKEDENRKKDI